MEQAHAANPAMHMESTPSVETMQRQDHWLIQVVGGLTLANTIVSSLAVFWIFLEYGV